MQWGAPMHLYQLFAFNFVTPWWVPIIPFLQFSLGLQPYIINTSIPCPFQFIMWVEQGRMRVCMRSSSPFHPLTGQGHGHCGPVAYTTMTIIHWKDHEVNTRKITSNSEHACERGFCVLWISLLLKETNLALPTLPLAFRKLKSSLSRKID